MRARHFVDWRRRRVAHDLSLPRGRRNSGTLLWHRLRLQRLDIGGESEDLFLSQLFLESRHRRRVPGEKFLVWVEKPFPEIGIFHEGRYTQPPEKVGAQYNL